jgi:hypothetical protein
VAKYINNAEILCFSLGLFSESQPLVEFVQITSKYRTTPTVPMQLLEVRVLLSVVLMCTQMCLVIYFQVIGGVGSSERNRWNRKLTFCEHKARQVAKRGGIHRHSEFCAALEKSDVGGAQNLISD